ncbi:stalk domain-containing protein [Paenibacillus tarimensis]
MMKFRKIIILLFIMSLWGGTMLFANSATQKVRVVINGLENDETGILSEGKTYLPLRQIVSSLQAIVVWDDGNKRASIFKPNVHMFLFQDQKIFGNVNKGKKYTFNVFSQIDNLKTEISAVKVAIVDPSGKEEMIQSENIPEQKDNFWFATKEIRYGFDFSGKYTVRFYMKPSGSEEWVLVSEKTITSQ